MKCNPRVHHRKPIRLKGYDYTQPGAYFVTFCSCQRDEIFGEVKNGEMKLSALGGIVCEEWLRSAEIRKEIQIFEDEFMIMPNHGYGIVWTLDTPVGAAADRYLLRPGCQGRRPVTATSAKPPGPNRTSKAAGVASLMMN